MAKGKRDAAQMATSARRAQAARRRASADQQVAQTCEHRETVPWRVPGDNGSTVTGEVCQRCKTNLNVEVHD